MEPDVERALECLAPAIDAKCEELREERKKRVQSRLFFLACAAVVIIPALLVGLGATLTILVAPIVFASLSLVLLLPVLLSSERSSQGRLRYENA